MKNIIIRQPKSDSLIGQLKTVYQIFSQIKQKEKVNFDLTNLAWVYPLLILTISAYIHDTGSKYILPADEDVLSYLNTVYFPKGISSVSVFKRGLNYIPISLLKREDRVQRERLESLFSMMVYKSLKAIPGTQNAVYYPITELVTNIFEHSKEDRGWIFAQFYPKKNFLDLCIIDRGRGLAKSYLEERALKVSDLEAIKLAMRGRSVKPDTERGYGIRTSKRVICEGLNGSLVLVSGNAGLVSKGKREKLVRFPLFNWQGVVISYRIPQPKESIDITPYLE